MSIIDCTKCKRYFLCWPNTVCGSHQVPVCYDFEPKESADLLTEMFRLQAELNAKYGFNRNSAKAKLKNTKAAIDADLYAGKWIHDYITAMTSELEELRDCIHWKHWHKEARDGKRFRLHDREHAKVEVVDLMFFVMSMAQALGMTAQDMYDLYLKKTAVNHERRDQDMTSEQAHDHELRPG